jgi:hypothetical protein
MPYYDVFWRKRRLTRREMHGIYTNHYTYLFWGGIFSIFFLLDLHGFAARISFWALVVYTSLMVTITVGVYLLVTAVAYKYARHHSRFFLFYPAVGFVAAICGTYIVEIVMSSTFGNGLSLAHAFEKLPTNIILTLVLETLYITFVLPVATGAAEPTEKSERSAPSPRVCTTLSLAGKTFYCDDLLSVSSEDHYVKIRTRAGAEMLRGRLSDMIGQLSCRDGIQPHRSHWVAREAVADMVAKDGHKYLELVDGSQIPVARGRIADVREWLES